MSNEKLEKALKNWQAKLADYEYELSITSSAEQKFELKQKIQECQAEIQRLKTQIDLNTFSPKPEPVSQSPPKPTSALGGQSTQGKTQSHSPWRIGFGLGIAALLFIISVVVAINSPTSVSQRTSTSSPSVPVDSPTSTPSSPALVASEQEYTELEDLLKTKKWKEADQKTFNIMLKVTGREKEGWIDSDSIDKFSCLDLKKLDKLWLDYSNKNFGFSVQKKVWQELGGKVDDTTDKTLGEELGWKKGGIWLNYNDLTFSLDAPQGHLPTLFARECRLGSGSRLQGGQIVVDPQIYKPLNQPSIDSRFRINKSIQPYPRCVLLAPDGLAPSLAQKLVTCKQSDINNVNYLKFYEDAQSACWQRSRNFYKS